MGLSRLFVIGAVVAMTSLASPVRAEGDGPTTITFKYQQKRFLYSRNGPGGLAYVPSKAPRGAALPVVVFLHGMNPDGHVHPYFGPPYGDLRPVVESLVQANKVAPFVLAAPTHTRYATGATVMWHDFDLADFLDATERALGDVATIDRSRIVVVGHSGAGCNPTGGIFAPSVRDAKPKAIVDVDGCLDEAKISALSEASHASDVRFYWQASWARPVADLGASCASCTVEEVGELAPNASPHVAILPEALRRALPELLPAK